MLHPQATCVIGNGVVLDPETLFGEVDELEAKGVSTSGRLFVSDRAHLVLPYHKLLDAAAERSQGIGTTGRGIGPAYQDKTGRRGVRVGDLRDRAALLSLLDDRVERANAALAAMGAPADASLEQHVAMLDQFAPRLLAIAADTGLLV